MPGKQELPSSCEESLPDRGVPGNGPRLQQRLQLPEGGGAVVVSAQRVQGKDELARAAVGPQAQIHPVGVSFRRVGGEVRAQRLDHGRGLFNLQGRPRSQMPSRSMSEL